ncbi:hypothetical protein THRCLA_21451 [Thraustotheca clavata]|uniref:Uncharacterized protein n=1 Tax=Thraustotheca clavata TaxID=74557 RepID=A0A1V9ZWA7_9STRA|nr:hypothetical protein THRCLA_21451 [Thraustotheca clavata]
MGKHHTNHAAPSIEVDAKTMLFLIKFLNTSDKSKILDVFEGHLNDHQADKIVDQRLFGGLTKLDDILEKKIMRKKKYEEFQNLALQWAAENKPKEKKQHA